MNVPLLITLISIFAAGALLLSDRLRADVVALMLVIALGMSGVLTPQEALSGFSRSAVITILSIFILAEGLKRTGVTDQVGALLLRVGGREEWKLVTITMVAGAFLSLFMNNIASAAVLLPAVTGAARKSQVKLSRLLLPLAFSTILGGMATLLTTTNIIASSLLRDRQIEGFGLLDFFPLGAPLVVGGVLFMALVGRRLLPQHGPEEPVRDQTDLLTTYHLEESLLRVRLLYGSPWIGKTLAQSSLRKTYNLNVLAIERSGQMLLSPEPKTSLQQGDILLLEGNFDNLPNTVNDAGESIRDGLEVLPARRWDEHDLESPLIAVVEVVLAPRSTLIGQSLQDAHFRDKFGMVVLAIWRAGRSIRTGIATQPLQFGDALLLQGPVERLKVLRSEPDLILLDNDQAPGIQKPGKGWLALAIMGAVLVGASINSAIVGEVMLAGALAMVLTGLLSMDDAYRAVEWKSVFLVAGMLPLGIAVTKTGAAELVADWLIIQLGPAGPLIFLAGLFIVTTLFTQIMNGAAVAAVMIPISITAALSLGLNPRSLVMAVTLATSMAFITPLGHAVNILVMGPGGYTFRHYSRVGLPLTVVLTVIVLLLLPLIWPL